MYSGAISSLLPMYPPWRTTSSRRSVVYDDTFQHVYLPLLKISLKISTIKYILLLIYSIHQMRQHLSQPADYCTSSSSQIGHAHFHCSSCPWIQNLAPNLPNFPIFQWFFDEQCAYFLVLFFASCSLFLYAVWLIRGENGDLKIRYRAVLTLPSIVFELLLSFLLYYSTVISLFEYSKTAESNPNAHSSAFIIYALIVSIFYAISLVLHFTTLYYMMITPVEEEGSNYALSNMNYYSQSGRSQQQQQYDTLQAPPLLRNSAPSSVVYSQIRSWNNTMRSTTNTVRTQQQQVLRDDDSDYLELI